MLLLLNLNCLDLTMLFLLINDILPLYHHFRYHP